jgi:hypothetical protein
MRTNVPGYAHSMRVVHRQTLREAGPRGQLLPLTEKCRLVQPANKMFAKSILFFALATSCGSSSTAFVSSHFPLSLRSVRPRCVAQTGLAGLFSMSDEQPALHEASAPALGRRQALGFFGQICAASVLGFSPYEALAFRDRKEKQDAAKEADATPTISLKQFYDALYAQEVKSVEFDGPKFEVCSLLFHAFLPVTLLVAKHAIL